MLRTIVVLVACGALGVYVAQGLVASSVEVERLNEVWIEKAEKASQNSITDQLFRSAVAEGLIRYYARTDELVVMTPREFQVMRGVEPIETDEFVLPSDIRDRGDLTSRDAARFPADVAMDLLWRSRGPGAEIRQLIDNLLSSRVIIAVRDSGLTGSCRALDEEQCRESPWTIQLTFPDPESDNLAASAEPGSPSPSAAMRIASPDPTVFSALARGTTTPFSNWSFADGREIAASTFLLQPQSAQAAGNGEVLIDIIGRNIRAPIDASLSYFCFDTGTRSVRLAPCDDPDRAVAARIRMPWDGRDTPPKITVRALELPLVSDSVRATITGQRDPQSQKRGDLPPPQQIRLDDRLSLSCRPESDTCDPILETTYRLSRLSRDLTLQRSFAELETSDPDTTPSEEMAAPPPVELNSEFVELVGPDEFALTKTALELELVPSIGLPGVAFGTYLGFLQNLPSGVQAQDLRLTFDKQLQEITQGTLRDFLSGGEFPAQQDRLIAGVEDRRRAALVLVDLADGIDQGAVRAAVGYPFFTGEASLWDLQARAREAEGSSTIAAPAWRGLDSRFQPGSSFKIVSALSLARTAAGSTQNVPAEVRSRIERVFLGAGEEYYDREIGLDLGSRAVPINRSRVGGLDSFDLRDRGARVYPIDQSVHSACGRDDSFLYGVCEALARSSNIWFGFMSLFENTNTIEALYGTSGAPPQFTGAGQTLHALGLARGWPLVRLPAGIDPAATFAPQIEAPYLASAPGLGRGVLVPDPRGLHELNLALNGYGQNAQVTPLAMATIAGSIGLGYRVLPFIARTEDAAPAGRELFLPNDSRSRALLTVIRQGMAAVMKPGGTGFSGFGRAGPEAVAMLPRVFGKTGTAEIGSVRGQTAFTHWFVGWVDGIDGRPEYAFACAVSHVDGGSPCATITAEWLKRVQRAGRL
ncbi:MAG: penicillin-binding transpeptidase domain-containing protein [Rhodobacter sp.]|nr:penicillin-binding transpeptidase domain-containing protein [Rhodobacter sp.]